MAGTFIPSVAGKKLLHYRGPPAEFMVERTAEMEEAAFDGLILGGYRPFYKNEKPFDFDAWAVRMGSIPFRRYTDNFYLCYSSVDAVEETDFDWFHDFGRIVENWRTMAKAARDAGFKGICFDSEYYAGKPLFGYGRQTYSATRTFAEYADQAQRRGTEIMEAVVEVYPDITILFLFGFSGSFTGVPQHPPRNVQAYDLVAPFVDGMLSACGPRARIFDMHEQSFSFRVPGSYTRARRMMTEIMPRRSRVPEAYRARHRAGFSVWADCWGGNGKGRAFDVSDFETNYYTPDELAFTIHHALAYSDGYVWMWPGAIRWWDRKVRTVDASGEEVDVALPPAYLDALRKAHEAELSEPPRDRKANTWRTMPAETQARWADKETFGDLWAEYTFVSDLPESWKFRIDPDQVGLDEGWAQPGYDAAAWRSIRIREFWENQGVSPYDGCAWYRAEFEAPPAAEAQRLFLAFGAVADEATVFVNGRRVYESEPGENIRHERFLAEVTDVLEPGRTNHVAVRVWNVSWCGGIWKNVKLVAR